LDKILISYILLGLLALILLLPLFSRRIERNLEIFFFAMGIVAATISFSWSIELVAEAFKTPLFIRDVPIGIVQVVFIASLLFGYYSEKIDDLVESLRKKISTPILLAILAAVLGLGSSIISVIVASVIISEIAFHINIPRKLLTRFLIASAYALGIGAALTPVGEPLSTIAVHKLSGEPYHADFLFLVRLLGVYIIPLVLAYSLYIYFYSKRFLEKHLIKESVESIEAQIFSQKSSLKDLLKIALERSVRVYLFIFALVLIGESYKIIVELYLKDLPSMYMYLFGSISAIVDNATLTATVIDPELSLLQIKSFLISLLIAGGFLIPGNIPNIVMANIHKIEFREWAREAIPIGIIPFIILWILIEFLNL